MPWMFSIRGSERDLAYLAGILRDPGLSVSRHGEDTVILSNEFDGIADHREANRIAQRLLHLTKAMLKLDWLSEGTIEPGGLIRVDEEGKRHFYVFVDEFSIAMDKIRAHRDGATFPDKEVPRRYARLCMNDANVARALIFFAHPHADSWRGMFPVYEVIEQDVGGKHQVSNKGLASRVDVERFLATAHNPKYSGIEARHGADRPGRRVPDRPMSTREGQIFIRSLLLAWLDRKVAEDECT